MENTNYPLQENIQALVNGELDAASRKKMLEEAQQLPGFEEELAFSQSLARALKHQEMVEARVILNNIIQEEGFPATAPTPRVHWRFWMTTVLLSCVITGAFFWASSQGYFLSDAQKLSRQSIQPLDNVLYLPQSGAEIATLKEGMAAYDAGDYPRAAKQLAAYNKLRPDNTALLYQGIAHLLAHTADAAIDPLTRAATSPEPPVKEAALWYLALAQLEKNEWDAARSTLSAIPADGIFGADAQELLKKIP
jgi:hypothetical protein